MKLAGLRILVTGGLGYIGSETARQLTDVGADVHVIDDCSEGHIEAWDGPWTRIDLRDRDRFLTFAAGREWDAVFHFAARCYVGESMRDPMKYWGGNIPTLLHLLEGIHTCPVIFSSSCATYGLPQSKTIDETHPQNPVNPYGETKLVGETILKQRARTGGGEVGILRYFNAAGATLEHGEDHRPETHLIPLAIRAALGQRGKLSVFGGDYDTRDGSCVRDFVHVSDLARAHILALEWIRAGNGSGEWNLGSGIGSSVLEVIRAVETVTGKPVPHAVAPRREGDPPRLVASAQKAREQLGWSPQFTSLEAIVESAVQWHERAPKGYDSLSY